MFGSTQAPADDGLTLAAAGVLAYVSETVGHELVGHGGICLASGGAITALAPLWMRCSVVTPGMVLAGPLFNFVAAAIIAAILIGRPRTGPFGYLLWLTFAFNLLVACGYMMVGGALAFGDWDVVLSGIFSGPLWRIGVIVVGGTGYFLGLRCVAGLYARIAGPAKDDRRLFLRRTLLSAAASGAVAIMAEVVGGRVAPVALILPLACTVFVGWSVSTTDPSRLVSRQTESLVVRRDRTWQIAALVVAVVFIGVIGRAPGAG